MVKNHPLAPHRVRFAPQNSPLESADCNISKKLKLPILKMGSAP